ncbi:uncharacterized protein LOC119110486 [Pollicipes pollicipes]|uniref:uncharacterized protein LOC119110486 n=1 Tax=Pollicipes pollicipes TaxID=41117 RepID=UPI0018856C2E|nr:uncharacterized protein LOC119110486 [Pollicipes pollicipes]
MSRASAMPPLDKTDSLEKLDKFTALDSGFHLRQAARHSRKCSFPSTYHSAAQEVRPRRKSSHVVPSSDRMVSVPRRKFSNVSDVVARKLSTTIGWRTHNITDIVHQSKSLCSQYVRARLKRSGAFHRKLGLQRLSSLASLHGGAEICEVFREMALIGVELERMHPSVFTAISRQVNMAITSDKTVRAVVNSVAVDLFRTEVTWGRIIALYAVAGGLAVECVKLGHPEYLMGLIESMGMVAERDTGQWIASQGGWAALLTRFRPPNTEPSIGGILVTGGAGLLAVAVFLMVLLPLAGQGHQRAARARQLSGGRRRPVCRPLVAGWTGRGDAPRASAANQPAGRETEPARWANGVDSQLGEVRTLVCWANRGEPANGVKCLSCLPALS